MRPDDMLARRVAREVEAEITALQTLTDELRSAGDTTDSIALRARGSILHDFYTGTERMFIRIAEELNGGVPRGEQWHRQLLRDMSLEIPGVRPALISPELEQRLADYLRFRHLFRNVYGFVLEADRMRSLELDFESVLAETVSQIRRFLSWMTGGA